MTGHTRRREHQHSRMKLQTTNKMKFTELSLPSTPAPRLVLTSSKVSHQDSPCSSFPPHRLHSPRRHALMNNLLIWRLSFVHLSFFAFIYTEFWAPLCPCRDNRLRESTHRGVDGNVLLRPVSPELDQSNYKKVLLLTLGPNTTKVTRWVDRRCSKATNKHK